MKKQETVIFITGASSGIGLSTAEYLSAQGYRVIGTSRSKPSSESFQWVPLDITDEQAVEATLRKVVQEEGRIDVLINNAGLGITGPLEETSEAHIRRVFDTNVWATLRLCRLCLPVFRRQGSGLIINVGSIAGKMGLPFRGIYSASKASVEILTEALSMEVKAQGIRVCSVLPGDVDTPINMHRLVSELDNTSPYRSIFERVHQQINQEVSKAPKPIVIAKVIASIISNPSPRLHYSVGPWLQRLAIWLKILLPQRLFEHIMMRFYGL